VTLRYEFVTGTKRDCYANALQNSRAQFGTSDDTRARICRAGKVDPNRIRARSFSCNDNTRITPAVYRSRLRRRPTANNTVRNVRCWFVSVSTTRKRSCFLIGSGQRISFDRFTKLTERSVGTRLTRYLDDYLSEDVRNGIKY